MKMRKFTEKQLEAIHSLEQNTVVSAGAGSGKTSVLVERYLYLLQPETGKKPVSTQEILAITFTRKAATEMRQRIRSGIVAKLQSPGEDHGYWQEQLTNLDKAQIGTIHSLCNSILKNNPVESNLDPAFTVAEEREAAVFLETQTKNFVRQQLRAKNPEVLQLTGEYGSVRFLRQVQQLWQEGNFPPPEADLRPPYEQALALAESSRQWLQENCTEKLEFTLSQKNWQRLQESWPQVRQALAGAVLTKDQGQLLAGTLGALKANSKTDRELVKAIRENLNCFLSIPVLQQALQLIPAWQHFLTGLRAYVQTQKAEAGLLSFDDLEQRALELLDTCPQVLEKCRQKYHYLMVDEFQDTNERQRQLIYLLAGGAKDKLLGNHLFVVGDAKQSIYRFRGADVQVFAQVREEIQQQGGKDIVLAKNFRSQRKVLEFCNQVFGVLLDADRQHNMTFEPLEADDEEGQLQPHFWVLDYQKDQREEERSSEARLMAAEIIRLHQEEQLDFNKIYILLRTMTPVATYATALQEAGVPYAIVDGRGFFDRQEILDLLNLCAVLVNPRDNTALTGVLRSPYFGIDDNWLTRMYLEGAEPYLWDKLPHWQDQEPQLARAWKILQELQQLAACLSLPDLLNAIEEALDPVTVLLLQDGGREKVANYQKFVTLAVNFAAQGGTTVTWLQELRQQREDQVREAAATVISSDAVTIMTIHKAKGLEADTVFVPNLDARTETDKVSIKYLPGQGLGISVCNENEELVETPVLQNFKAVEKELNGEERSRLLYVAMTRAQQRLYLLGGHLLTKSSSKTSNWVTELQSILGAAEQDLDVRQIDLTATKIEAPAALTAVQAGAALPPAAKLAPLPGFGLHNSTYFSASALQEYLYCPRRYYYEVVEQLPPLAAELEPAGRQLAATAIGHLAHQVLERYDGTNFAAVYRQAVQEHANGNLALAAPVQKMLEQYLASPLYQSLRLKSDRRNTGCSCL
jgi:ATP-dependent helicase/nuclease subunit A